MKYIVKKTAPEQFEKWKTYKKPTHWNDFDGKTIPLERRIEGAEYYSKEELRSYLLDEQSHVCCYCEMRIVNNPLTSKIEHVEPREGDTQTERIFDYNNLSLSCNGGERDPKPKLLHCDSSKKSKPLPFSHLDKRCEVELAFTLDGQIINKTQDAKEVIKILNLHIPKLKNARESAISGFIYTNEKKTELIKQEEKERLLNQLNNKYNLPFQTAIIAALNQI